jgi:hypothetical protein
MYQIVGHKMVANRHFVMNLGCITVSLRHSLSDNGFRRLLPTRLLHILFNNETLNLHNRFLQLPRLPSIRNSHSQIDCQPTEVNGWLLVIGVLNLDWQWRNYPLKKILKNFAFSAGRSRSEMVKEVKYREISKVSFVFELSNVER